jgi:hypothetical protein
MHFSVPVLACSGTGLTTELTPHLKKNSNSHNTLSTSTIKDSATKQHYKQEMWTDFRTQLQKIHGRALVTFAGNILLLLLFKLVDGIIKV